MKKFMSILTMITLFLFTVLAFAQQAPSEPQSIQEAVGYLAPLYGFAKAGQWPMAAACLVMVLVFAFRQYLLPKIGLTTKVLPLVSALLGVLVAVAGPVFVGVSPESAAMAVVSGPMASVLWQAVFKYFLPEAPKEVKG